MRTPVNTHGHTTHTGQETENTAGINVRATLYHFEFSLFSDYSAAQQGGAVVFWATLSKNKESTEMVNMHFRDNSAVRLMPSVRRALHLSACA